MQKSLQNKLWHDLWLSNKSWLAPDKFALVLLLILLPHVPFSLLRLLETDLSSLFCIGFLSIITRIYAYRRRPEAKKFLSYQMALSTGLISFPLGYYLPTFAFQFGDTEAATASLCVLLIILPVLCLFEVASRFAFHRSLNRAKEHIS